MFPASRNTRCPWDALYAYDGELKRALDVADAYGFTFVPPLRLEADDRKQALECTCPEHHVAALKLFDTFAGNSTDGVIRIAHTHKVPYKNKLELRLEIIGDRESSAEGLMFQTIQSILQEYGYKSPLVTINTVGGKESLASFGQAVATHFRSKIADMHPECRDAFRRSPFAPFRCDHEECKALRTEAPQSLNFLTEQSKQHFKETLEYLESFDIPYIVDPYLVGNEQYASRTSFLFKAPRHKDEEANPPIVAWGERYDQLARKLGIRRSAPAINVTFDLPTKTVRETFRPRNRKTPIHVHVIHAGTPAKIRSLKLTELLRGSHIRVKFSLHQNSVADQLERARSSGVSLLIILGHKEVLDGTVMVRHVDNSRQESIPMGKVASYLRAHL